MVFSVGNMPARLHSVHSSEPGSAPNVAGSPQADEARGSSSGCSSAVWKNMEFRQLCLVFGFFFQGLIECLAMGWPVWLW